MTLLTTHNPIRPLSEATASELMRIFIDQDTDALLVGACLALLAQRGPEAHELAAFADALSEVAVPFPAVPEGALDTCGTGGDGSSTANLSTLAALLLAHLGVPIVKHGNRAATSVCGSADLLEALGYDLARASADLSQDLRAHGFAFLFAPAYHPLLGRLREIRRRLGIPTIFNLLGLFADVAGAVFIHIRAAFGAGAHGFLSRKIRRFAIQVKLAEVEFGAAFRIQFQ